MKTRTFTAISAIGLFIAAASWALHQQAEYVLASLVCGRNSVAALWSVTAAAIILLLIALAVTLRSPAYRSLTESNSSDFTRPRTFLASLSLLAALLFFFAVFLQAGALLFLASCAQ